MTKTNKAELRDFNRITNHLVHGGQQNKHHQVEMMDFKRITSRIVHGNQQDNGDYQ